MHTTVGGDRIEAKIPEDDDWVGSFEPKRSAVNEEVEVEELTCLLSPSMFDSLLLVKLIKFH